MAEDEAQQLQREWRASTTRDIADIRVAIHEISDTLNELRGTYAERTDLDRVRDSVHSLESDRAKLVGAFVVLQIVGGIVIWAINKVIK